MKFIIFTASTALLAGCASQHVHSSSNYIGDGQIEVVSYGDNKATSDDIRAKLYRQAYLACEPKNKGFKIVGDNDLKSIPHWVDVGELIPDMVPTESYRIVVRCDGAVDPELQEKYSKEPI